MKKLVLTLLVGLFLFVGGGLFAEDLSPPIFQDGINIKYVMNDINQVAIASTNMVDIYTMTSFTEVNYHQYPITIGSSEFRTGVGLNDTIFAMLINNNIDTNKVVIETMVYANYQMPTYNSRSKDRYIPPSLL